MNQLWSRRDRSDTGDSCRPRRWRRWLWPAALVLLMPKCVLCLVAYMGAGTVAAGLDGVEWCGGRPGVSGAWLTLGAWLGATGVLLMVIGRCRKRTVERRARSLDGSTRGTLVFPEVTAPRSP